MDVTITIDLEDEEPLGITATKIARAILRGDYDDELELILEAGHNRKRFRRGVRVLRARDLR